jgi:hypothetical protein
VRVTICGVCLWLVASLCSATGPLDGKWNAHVVRPAPAGDQDLAITLATTPEGKVTGSMTIIGGPNAPIDWGMVKGDLVVFKVRMPFNEGTQMFVYLGRLEGDQISFGRRPEDLTLGRLVEFSATRAK